MDSQTLIEKITKCAQAIEKASVGLYMNSQDQAVKDEMRYIEEQAKEIASAIGSLSEQLR